MNRRTFYERTILALGGLINAALAIPAVGYLFGSNKSEQSDGWTDAGSLSVLQEGKPTEIVVQRSRHDAWRTAVEKLNIWAVKQNDEQVIAYAPQCPHLGCGYHWVAERDVFLCPCHDSTFSIDGEVLTGPSPRPLDRFETRIQGDRLWLGAVHRSTES